MNEPRFKLDLQGLIRTVITVGTILGAYYLDRQTLNDKIAQNKSDFAQMQVSFDAHCNSVKTPSISELDERFVTRREWESSKSEIRVIREDMKYLRDKVDKIYEKISK